MKFAGPALNVTLVKPPTLQLRTNLSSYGAILPIGLGYIAAVLRDAGHNIKVIDGPGEALDRTLDVKSPIGTLALNGLTPKQIINRLDPSTQILGVSHMFLHEWPTIREIVERAKQKIPDLVVILGGENATSFWPWIFKATEAVDYCVLGEGEQTILELLSRLIAEQPTDDIQGLVSRETAANPGNVNQPLKPSKRNVVLEQIPRPAWEYFPVEKYMQTADHYGVNRGRSIPMLATRGCPYQCTFCSSPQMWTTRYVTRNSQEVVDEIKSYIEKYQINNVNFCDLTAIVKREWIIEFGNILKRERLDITWQLPSGTRSEVLDEEVLKLVYETGCRNITFAPENGSERMLKAIKKKVQIPRMLNALRAAQRASIVSRVNIIIGHPAEQRRDIWKSLLFLIQCAWIGCQDAAVMIFAPYPGSEDFQKLMEQGKVQITEDYYYLPLARSGWSSRTYNPLMGTRELIMTQFFLLVVFYSIAYITRPWRILDVIRSIFTGNEETQLDQLIRTKWQQFSPWEIIRFLRLLPRILRRRQVFSASGKN